MSTDAAAPAPDTDETAELRARLAALEAENARLRGVPETAEPRPRAPRAGWWRAVLSAVCIVLASLTVPVSIVGAWARVQLVDETQFVGTFAPLASDPTVQGVVVDQVTAAIDDSVDLEGITNDLFDGIAALGLPDRASAALDLLRQPAADGLKSIVDGAVTQLVESDAFAAVWQSALHASHRALVAAASGGSSNGALTISDSGEIGIQLEPIIEEVKTRLVEQGIGFAANIPVIERTIVVAQADALVTVAVVYNIAVTAGTWLPFVTLGLFVLGILLARRRTAAFIGTGVGLALGAGVLAIGLSVGGAVLGLAAPNLGLPAAALQSVYAQVIGGMQHSALVLLLIGMVVAVFAWAQGRSRAARATRAAVGSVNAGLRRALAGRGVDTGRVGGWLYAQRVLVRVVLAVLAVLWLLLLQPLSAGDVFLVLIVALLVWWLAELAQRRPEEHAEGGSAAPPEPERAAESAPVV